MHRLFSWGRKRSKGSNVFRTNIMAELLVESTDGVVHTGNLRSYGLRNRKSKR
jgi:hypothetical protein